MARPSHARDSRSRRTRAAGGAVPPILPNADSAVLAKLRELLTSSGYIDLGIEPADAAVGVSASPLNTLMRLFHFEEGVSVEEAAAALCPLTVEQLIHAGVVRRLGKRVFATVHIQAYGGLLFALPAGQQDDGETVMCVSPSSRELDKITVRRHSGTTLDVGTGCGVQTALAARHSDHVYAVDLNPRAIAFAEFNCRWNGIQNVTFLQGSCLEPVRNRKFDLIVTNPPFVISPTARLMYRDSGMDGDAFCIRLARDAAQLLNEGGFFQMIFQWVETTEMEWRQQLLQSFSGLGCDVWVLRVQSDAPASHVAAWIKDTEKESEYSKWMQYLANRHAASIGMGFCIMKRVTGRAPRVWLDDAPEEYSEECGEAVARIFSIREQMEGLSDADLLEQRWLTAPGLRLIQQSRCDKDSWQPAASEFLLTDGLKYVFGNVDAELARLVSACDGERTLRMALETVALKSRNSPADLISNYLPQMRELARFGFLTPGVSAGLQFARAEP